MIDVAFETSAGRLPEAMMTKSEIEAKRADYYGHGQLLGRGWPANLVERLMPHADATWHVNNDVGYAFYSATRVRAIESKSTFATMLRRAQGAKAERKALKTDVKLSDVAVHLLDEVNKAFVAIGWTPREGCYYHRSKDGEHRFYRNKKRHRDDGPAVISPDGSEAWYFDGDLHRVNGPAVVRADGSAEWFQHGRWHRQDGPAVIRRDGTEEWWLHGKWHRLDGPARVESDGVEEWYQDGRLHRLNGPAVVHTDGTEEWYQCGWYHRQGAPAIVRSDGSVVFYHEGKRHRLIAPAVIDADGSHEWWEYGQKHRLDGPAVIHADGSTEWYAHDRDITAKVKALLADGVVRPNWREWTDADWFAFTMQTAGEDA